MAKKDQRVTLSPYRLTGQNWPKCGHYSPRTGLPTGVQTARTVAVANNRAVGDLSLVRAWVKYGLAVALGWYLPALSAAKRSF
jgi:hypothetical protein